MQENEIYIKLSNLELSALTFGEKGDYPTLAVHGWLDNANSFNFLLPKISNLYTVAIDLPGHGKSSHAVVNNYFHYIDYILNLVETLNVLGFEKCNLIGHSLGAGLCTILAGTFPERFNRVILLDGIGPVAYDNTYGPAALKKATQQALAKPKKSPVYKDEEEAAIARANSKISKVSINAARELVKRGIKKASDGYIWSNDPKLLHTSAISFTQEQVLDFIRNIESESLLIIPKEGYEYHNKNINERIQNYKSLTVVNVDGNHHAHMDNSDEVAKVINEFLMEK